MNILIRKEALRGSLSGTHMLGWEGLLRLNLHLELGLEANYYPDKTVDNV